jgi:hypothetical protein
MVRGAVLLFLTAAWTAEATTVRWLSLQELVDRADRIFVGTVAAVSESRDEQGRWATFVTFTVSQSLKGNVPRELKIKQFGRKTPAEDGSILRIPGLPTYEVGEEAVLFLDKDSRWGFTSPVGLGQGKFKVIHQASKAYVVNAQRHKTDAQETIELEGFLADVQSRIRTPK